MIEADSLVLWKSAPLISNHRLSTFHSSTNSNGRIQSYQVCDNIAKGRRQASEAICIRAESQLRQSSHRVWCSRPRKVLSDLLGKVHFSRPSPGRRLNPFDLEGRCRCLGVLRMTPTKAVQQSA